MTITAEQGSLDAGVDWNDVDRATEYLVRWRMFGPGNPLNEGVRVESSSATISVADYGDWVVRIEACNGVGCGRHQAQRFTAQPPDNRAPAVDEDAANYDGFIASLNAPRGTTVHKGFEGIFTDADGDDLTYTVTVPGDRTELVELLGIREDSEHVSIRLDGDDDWSAVVPALPDPLVTAVTLTATDPDGLSTSLTGYFSTDWESQPVAERAEYQEETPAGEDAQASGDAAAGDGGNNALSRAVVAETARQSRTRTPDCNGSTVEVTFDQNLQTDPAPSPSQFTVNVTNSDGSTGTIGVCSVSVNGRVVTLTLESVVRPGQTLTLDYVHRDASPLKRDAVGGDSAGGFVGMDVSPTVTLVSNIGKDTASIKPFHTRDHAQGFRTGTHPGGYTLTAVKLSLVVGTTVPSYSVSICPESSGKPTAPCLGTLDNPTSLSDGTNEYTASGTGIVLTANTTYFMVLDTQVDSTRAIFLEATNSDAEDDGASAGWSIADTAWEREGTASTWTDSDSRARKISITGSLNLADYDADADGLIEIRTAAQLNAIRWDTDGNGTVDAANQTNYEAAFPLPAAGMGCPSSGCTGYELAGDIDLGVAPYNADAGWVPISTWAATLEGNGRAIRNLYINKTTHEAGLFRTMAAAGKVRNLGLTDVDIRAASHVGALVWESRGEVVGTYSTGRITATGATIHGQNGAREVGGLVGRQHSRNKIHASHSSVSVHVSSTLLFAQISDIGGLVGFNSGEVKSSYASGSVTVEDAPTQSIIGGLAGQNTGQIQASYSVATVFTAENATAVGGLAGDTARGGGAAVTDSYWDMEATGLEHSSGGTGKTTLELAGPTGYTGIYTGWNLDLDGDGTADDPWDFGTEKQYPAIRIPDIKGRPTPFFPCVENIELRPWRDIYADRAKDSHPTESSWADGCYSRDLHSRHARYFTFTLTEATRVRLHVESNSLVVNPASPRLALRRGVSLTPLHVGSVYGHPIRSRIDAWLIPGTYSLEVAADIPQSSSFQFSLWAGTAADPPELQSFVSNIGQENGSLGHFSTVHAQGFTTGANSEGYKLTSVDVNIGQYWGSPIIVVTIRASDDQGKPTATVLHTLTSPAQLGAGSNRFTASGGGLDLDPSTKYFVHVWGRGGSAIQNTRSDTVDPGAAEGWSMDSNGYFAWSIGGAWNNWNDAREMSINGHAKTSCFKEIDWGETDAGRWDSACPSSENPGSYARYYTYTPTADGSIAVTLTSPDAEEKLYLREDGSLVAQHSSLSASCYGRCASVLHRVKANKTYTIEVTTDGPGQTGRYLLALRGTSSLKPAGYVDAAEVSPAECRKTMGFGSQVHGNWEWPCYSMERMAAHARYYTFTLGAETDVVLELYSVTNGNTKMYLREGTKGSGTHLFESSNPTGPVRGRIAGRLPAGTYTVEVTATTIGRTGQFDLVLKSPPPKYTPAAHCVTDITISGWTRVSGEWKSEGCYSKSEARSYARYYRFTLTETMRVTLGVSSDDADEVLYLHRGASFSGPPAAGDGDLSLFLLYLEPGTWTVEATTNRYAGHWQTGAFEFTYWERD